MNFILKLYRKLVPEKVRRACNVSLQKMQTAYKTVSYTHLTLPTKA